MPISIAQAEVDRSGVYHRRGFLRSLVSGGVAAGVLGLSWRDLLLAKASDLRRSGKSMILLWMDGGPSQFETFNPKVGSAHQGPVGAISTNVPGVHIGEHWPRTAAAMDKIALIRSMLSNEADHFRAIKLVRTGYPIAPTIEYPTWGAVVARERWDPGFDLPAFVRVGKPRIKTRDVNSGVLGAKFASFSIDEPGKLPPDVRPTIESDVLARRLALSARLDNEYAKRGAELAVREKQAIYERTSRFVLSPLLSAFDLSREQESLRDRYGRNPFGQGCLLARRLVEHGVSFIEVINSGTLNDQGWDTHKNGFVENPQLAAETDSGYATLLVDLADRGLLENTLVVWMGEFGREPKFKEKEAGGREHYAEGWITCLSGAGLRTGQAIGATDADGVKITDRPVSVPDLFATFCRVLGLDPHEEYVTDRQQPIKLVTGGEPIGELF
jgi:hypothetical protein